MNQPESRKQLLLCCASDADGSTFRLCRNADEAMAFYKEMWGDDLGGGVQSQIDHFNDEDNWSHGMTKYSCELYCSNFRVWRVDQNEVSLPSETETPTDRQIAVKVCLDAADKWQAHQSEASQKDHGNTEREYSIRAEMCRAMAFEIEAVINAHRHTGEG